MPCFTHQAGLDLPQQKLLNPQSVEPPGLPKLPPARSVTPPVGVPGAPVDGAAHGCRSVAAAPRQSQLHLPVPPAAPPVPPAGPAHWLPGSWPLPAGRWPGSPVVLRAVPDPQPPPTGAVGGYPPGSASRSAARRAAAAAVAPGPCRRLQPPATNDTRFGTVFSSWIAAALRH